MAGSFVGEETDRLHVLSSSRLLPDAHVCMWLKFLLYFGYLCLEICVTCTVSQ